MRLVDAHCHFDFPVFDGHRKQIVDQAREQGVSDIVIPGVRSKHWPRVQSVAGDESVLWYCLGVHPWFVAEHRPCDLVELERLLGMAPERCLGLGECGLDALAGQHSMQEYWFRAQVRLASNLGLPLVIHSVKAHDQVYQILREERWQGKAVIHGFSGSYQQACKFVDLGCFIGVGGTITYERAAKTRAAIARLPVEALVLETDAPDMPPCGIAKGKNSPLYLPHIFKALAGLREESPADLEQILWSNVGSLYQRGSGELPFVPRTES